MLGVKRFGVHWRVIEGVYNVVNLLSRDCVPIWLVLIRRSDVQSDHGQEDGLVDGVVGESVKQQIDLCPAPLDCTRSSIQRTANEVKDLSLHRCGINESILYHDMPIANTYVSGGAAVSKL